MDAVCYYFKYHGDGTGAPGEQPVKWMFSKRFASKQELCRHFNEGQPVKRVKVSEVFTAKQIVDKMNEPAKLHDIAVEAAKNSGIGLGAQ